MPEMGESSKTFGFSTAVWAVKYIAGQMGTQPGGLLLGHWFRAAILIRLFCRCRSEFSGRMAVCLSMNKILAISAKLSP
jgi:hypothetical protein